jgi:glutaredoxin
MAWVWRAIWVALATLVAFGCDRVDDGTAPVAAEDLPALELTDDTPELLLTWVDDRGRTHTGVTIAEVPEASRELVRVITPTGGHGAQLYVADLRQKQANGTYPVRTMKRADWDALIAKRRHDYEAKNAPPPPVAVNSAAPTANAGLTAIVYGASWCGPCHQAAAYLRGRGVRVVEYDVEKDPKYADEMQRKLAAAGKHGGTIPVIDVGGAILTGFSPGALDRAIKSARTGGTHL